MRSLSTGMGVAMLVAAMAVPSHAQGVADPVEARPDRSLQIGVGATPQIGYWMRMGERSDLGLVGGVSYHAPGEVWTFSAGPAWKRYAAAADAVAPYTYLGLLVTGQSRTFADDQRMSDLGLIGEGGLGLDWFPHPRISVGGHAGLRGGPLRLDRPGMDRETTWNFGTFTSGIRLHLYF